MKEIKSTKIIPQQEVPVIEYECESCGKKHHDKRSIYNCIICGKEVCAYCRHAIFVFPDKILNLDGDVINFGKYITSVDITNSSFKVCEKCASKFNVQKYLKEVEKIVDDFNSQISTLNKKSLKNLK